MRIIIILLLIVSYGTANAQPAGSDSILKLHDLKHQSSEIPKNNIYAGGSYYIILGSGTINYERRILRFGKESSACIFLRTGFGYWFDWLSGGPAGIISANMVFFKRASHLEAGLGAVALYDQKYYKLINENGMNPDDVFPSKLDCTIFNPAINLGYRYQEPGKKFLFRIGLSYPEGPVYLGLGIAF